ncbi:hypothetical protein DPMN_167481 [Dreissena polymorpha]|uniref:Uncharacterized protein n=1 Tax=Dreissena polymorpha TaxID=45954 RepID=A0A9D4IV32_DREPO|nr:hypothetical protein DPMN_167481 [Dreissena polymorpha]
MDFPTSVVNVNDNPCSCQVFAFGPEVDNGFDTMRKIANTEFHFLPILVQQQGFVYTWNNSIPFNMANSTSEIIFTPVFMDGDHVGTYAYITLTPSDVITLELNSLSKPYLLQKVSLKTKA